ncbi:Zinc finger, CCCH-type [Dillenia turbinata]|uniref:Zinc finger, CCCH-type n=1 Tax=Dillenia turbinata TaxID=194707 RepID=A0AAN8Z739_9MAGN
MIGGLQRSNPTVQVPPWDYYDDPTALNSPSSYPVSGVSVNLNVNGNSNDYSALLTALQRFLPSNEFDNGSEFGNEFDTELDSLPVDSFSCDNFRMFEFKVSKCSRGRSHDWTECPYAHAGEKARRRDPRKFNYSGTACAEFRKGSCRKGDFCEFAHGVFECWLHPTRYRTQPCKDGTSCRRRVCFFAHTPEQLRLLPTHSDSYDNSPTRCTYIDSVYNPSPTSTLMYHQTISPPSDSPPSSPSVNELASSMRGLQLGKMKMNHQLARLGSGISSPRSPTAIRPGFYSLPTTPTQTSSPARSGRGYFDMWDMSLEEEPAVERVESGRDLRARIYAKLSKENSVSQGPDVAWVSELVK